MPLSKKDQQIERKFEKRYGSRGKEVYYRTINSGKLSNTPEARKMMKKRKRSRGRR